MKLLAFSSHLDPVGSLTVAEIPFPVRRVFFLHDLPEGAVRGGHAHRELQEIIIAISGSFTVTTRTANGRQKWELNRATRGLYLEANVWRSLGNFSGNATALILASTEYDPADYIRDEAEYMAQFPPMEAPYITPDDIAEAVRKAGR